MFADVASFDVDGQAPSLVEWSSGVRRLLGTLHCGLIVACQGTFQKGSELRGKQQRTPKGRPTSFQIHSGPPRSKWWHSLPNPGANLLFNVFNGGKAGFAPSRELCFIGSSLPQA